ncbi:MAG: hypothetical protein U0802_04070 [Candidatus Binatia bacterium]
MRLLLTLSLWAALASPAGASCLGDCGGDGQVGVSELITGVGIALGSGSLASCPSFDGDGDGSVAIAELIAAVANALTGCADAATPTPTLTPTLTPPPTATATPAVGPDILFFGVTNSDDTLQAPSGADAHGVPIYERPFGFGFGLVVEARPGSAKTPVAKSAFTEGGTPDLQAQVTRPLGDGSPAVCDGGAPTYGGVPAVDPPRPEEPDAIADALNDLGCRFIDGTGQPVGRVCSTGCVRFDSGEFGCQSGDDAELQFCAPVSMSLAFPSGDTLVTVRVRDRGGNLGRPSQLIVRVP